MKWVYRLLGVTFGTILICALTVLTTGFVVNAYVQSLLGSMNIKWEGQPSNFAGLMKMASAGVATTTTSTTTPTTTSDGVGTSGQNEPASQTSSGTNASDSTKETGGSQASSAPEGALPVMGNAIEGEGKQAQDDNESPVLTPDQLEAKKDNISSQDKDEVFSMLMKKLPEAEMQKITTAMEGGLTETELIEIQQILSKYLNKDDYTKMLDIINK